MDKCLKEFEECFLKHKEKEQFDADLSKTNGRYNYTRTLNLWLGWKASRESMKVIKLPKHSNPVKDKTIMFISDVKILLESAGVKVEVEE